MRNTLILIYLIITVWYRIVDGLAAGSISSIDCFKVQGDSSAIICRSVPKFNANTYRILNQYSKIIFDLENKFILTKEIFYNCSFSWSNQIDIEFKNIKKISEYAFDYVSVGENVRVTIKFDGAGLNLDKSNRYNRLFIVKNAFKNSKVSKKSQLLIEIKNYKSAYIQDSLIDSVWLDVNSEIHLSVSNVEQVVFRNKNTDLAADYDDDPDLNKKDKSDTESSVIDHSNLLVFKNNISYSLEITHVDSLQFDSLVFSNTQINPYSGMAIIIRFVHNVYFGANVFELLMLGIYSQFNFLIENIGTVALGKNMFTSMQQDQNSVFFFQLDQMGNKYFKNSKTKRASEPDYDSEYYYDYAYDEPVSKEIPTTTSPYSTWLCIPEGFFKNIQHYELAVTQVHFTQIDMSISVSSLAFKEIQLRENSKFQIMFQELKGHCIFDKNAINLITISDGIFEIWIDSHKQQDLVRGINSDADQKAYRPKNKIDSFKLINSARNNYFEFMDLSVNQIFLTPRSYFRIAFVNSDSILLINRKSLNAFNVDRFDSTKSMSQQLRDYRTKISFKIDESENLVFDFMSRVLGGQEEQIELDEEDGSSDDDFVDNLPKIIEIDGYQPAMSLINSDGTIDLTTSDFTSSNITKLKNKLNVKTDNYLIKEFCQFYKIRSFMTAMVTLKPNKNVMQLKNNLIYFSQPVEYSDEDSNKTPQCTSCLYMYLYRTVHRRSDFYFVKDHLPKCFVNLHYGKYMHFQSIRDPVERDRLITKIEDTYKNYWKLLRCKVITGMDTILTHDFDSIKSDDIVGDYELLGEFCKSRVKFGDEINNIKTGLVESNWHDTSARICTRNIIDSKANKSSGKVLKKPEIGLRKINTLSAKTGYAGVKTRSWSSGSVIFLLFVIACGVVMAILFLKYKRPQKPCIKLNFNRSMKSFQRLSNPANASLRSNTPTVANKPKAVKTDDENEDEVENNEQSYDELNGYEYDDEFEMHDNSNKNANTDLANSSTENIEFKIMDSSSAGLPSAIGSIKNKSLKHIKRIKNNLFNKDILKNGLLNVTNMNHSHFSGGPNDSGSKKNKYPNYSYNSTDSTLVQTKIPNEFEISFEDKKRKSSRSSNHEDQDESENVKSVSVVTYDVSKQKAKQTILDRNKSEYDPENLQPEPVFMRLSHNPMDNLDLDKTVFSSQTVHLNTDTINESDT